VGIIRPGRLDVLLPVLIALAGVVEIIVVGYQPRWPSVGAFLLAAGVASRARVASLVVPPLTAAIFALTPLLGGDVFQAAAWVPLLAFGCFSAGLYPSPARWAAGLACVLLAVGISVAGLAWLTDFEPGLPFGLILGVGGWALGFRLRAALEQSRRAGAQAERARIEGALAAGRAVLRERERVAVELPDVLAHSLGAMVIQTSAAGDLLRQEPEAAARALGDVAQAGREALATTGRLLHVLRDDRDERRLRPVPHTIAGGPGALARPAAAPKIRSVDVLLPVVFGAVATVEAVSGGYRPFWVVLGALWLAVGLLCARRRFPLYMPIGVTVIMVGTTLLGAAPDDSASSILFWVLASFSAGRYVPRGRAALGFGSILASIGLFALAAAARRALSADLLLAFPFVVGPWAVGVALQAALERTRTLAAAAEGARLEQELQAERAAAEERRRIARELHDTLANTLNVMIVQASLAADVAVGNPDRAADAACEVERAGRAALGETERLLRLIRAGDDEAATRPQPGVTDIPALAAEYCQAGLEIALEMDSIERLPAGVDPSVYHVVKEALTNALKHAPGSPVRIRLARTPSRVTVEIRNGPARVRRPAAMPSGHGLTGLRERVSLFGGSLDAHPTPDGGFFLTATMPIPEAA
jgi:signal transduction histidine kinase